MKWLATFARYAFFDAVERFRALMLQVTRPALEHAVDELVFGFEVIVDRGDVDLGHLGDVADRGAGDAVIGEKFFSRIQDTLDRVRGRL
jgi:hypothetical protein